MTAGTSLDVNSSSTKIKMKPVSYTHLDVYKRQATTPSCGIPGLTTSTATAATTATLGGLIVIAPSIATGADTAIASGVTAVGTRTVGAVLSTGATAIRCV